MAGEKHCHIWALEARAENAGVVMEDVPSPREYLHPTTANRVRNRLIVGGARPQPVRAPECGGVAGSPCRGRGGMNRSGGPEPLRHPVDAPDRQDPAAGHEDAGGREEEPVANVAPLEANGCAQGEPPGDEETPQGRADHQDPAAQKVEETLHDATSALPA